MITVNPSIILRAGIAETVDFSKLSGRYYYGVPDYQFVETDAGLNGDGGSVVLMASALIKASRMTGQGTGISIR